MASIAIPLHSRKYPGLFTIIDEQDAELVNQYRWNPILIRGRFYAACGDGNVRLYLHRLIMDAQPGFDVDHVHGDTLNNTRSNLRVCTHRQNQQNIFRKVRSSSGYRGVTSTKSRPGFWIAAIKTNGERQHLGNFRNHIDAALAYDTAARKLFGDFGTYNFPRPGERSAITGEVQP